MKVCLEFDVIKDFFIMSFLKEKLHKFKIKVEIFIECFFAELFLTNGAFLVRITDEEIGDNVCIKRVQIFATGTSYRTKIRLPNIHNHYFFFPSWRKFDALVQFFILLYTFKYIFIFPFLRTSFQAGSDEQFLNIGSDLIEVTLDEWPIFFIFEQHIFSIIIVPILLVHP